MKLCSFAAPSKAKSAHAFLFLLGCRVRSRSLFRLGILSALGQGQAKLAAAVVEQWVVELLACDRTCTVAAVIFRLGLLARLRVLGCVVG